MSLTLAIIDNNPLLRDGMAALLSANSGITVVASCSASEAAWVALGELTIRVALIGVSCAGLPSSRQGNADLQHINFDVASRLMRHPSHPQVVLMNQDPSRCPKALIHAGVSAFVAGDAELDELIKALRLAGMGQRYVSPVLAQAWSFEAGAMSVANADALATLSAREIEVLHCILAEKRVVEIADLMSISPKTVATYRSRLMEKLAVRSDMALLRFAQAAGLCS